MDMEILTKSGNIKQKIELKMFDNMVTNNSNLLISVKGIKTGKTSPLLTLLKNVNGRKRSLIDPGKK